MPDSGDFAWQRLNGLERLYFELGRSIARRLEFSDVITRELAKTVGQETISNPTRSLFVAIPELFILRADTYAAMSGETVDGFSEARIGSVFEENGKKQLLVSLRHWLHRP